MWRSISLGKIPPIAIATKLFEALVKPILVYNSDVWGSEIPYSLQKHITVGKIQNYEEKYIKYINECPFEKVHLKFCKMVLGVRRQTSNIATRSEIGRFPLIIEIYVSIIKYWLRINKLPQDRLVVDALNANLNMQKEGLYTWTGMVKSILEEANYSDIWLAKAVPNQDSFIKRLRTRLQNNHADMIKCLMFYDNRPNNKGQKS